MLQKSWISLHIYCDTKCNSILLDKIHPYIIHGKNNQNIKQFFFLRYSDPRPHIRLRLKVDTSMFIKISQELKQLFKDSEFVSYKPEIQRYGGKKGILIAEDQFEISSKIALLKLQNIYSKTIYTALALQVSFLLALRLNKQEIKEMLNFFIEDRIIQNPSTGVIQNVLLNNKKILQSYVWDLLGLFKTKKSQPSDINEWMNATNTIYNELISIQRSGNLIQPKCDFLKNYTKSNCNKYIIWHILGDYIHLTNNRLGVKSIDEGSLLYILNDSLQDL